MKATQNYELVKSISAQIKQIKDAKKLGQERQVRDQELGQSYMETLFTNFSRGKNQN